MREADATTRERMVAFLREDDAALGTLANEFQVSTGVAADHLEHVAESLEHEDDRLLVAPPECRDCGFDEFDDPINRPSRCPACKSEAIEEPRFTIG
ncbi:transcriptional regulator [Halobacteriales archaeon SW_7_68_16]|nr:MAG: transcriptional regulator [Halobacteriales archaeon SW_7_68_16]